LRRITLKKSFKFQDVDALLGCPIWMPNDEIFDSKFDSLSPQEMNSTCEILFYCLNWFRELINTFATSTEAENKTKILIRLKHILKLHKNLSKCLSMNPGTFTRIFVREYILLCCWGVSYEAFIKIATISAES
jgi:Fanconi anemia group D2 protein